MAALRFSARKSGGSIDWGSFSPNLRRFELFGGGFGPAAVGGGGGGAGVEDGGDGGLLGNSDALETAFCKLAHSDCELGLEVVDDLLEVGVAGVEEGFLFGSGELVRGAVAAAFFHEDEGAVVGDEVLREEVGGVGVDFFEESPKSATGDFGFLAGEAFDDAFGVFLGGLAHGGFEAHPVAHVFDFAEGNSGLAHAPGTGVHAEEEDSFLRVGEAFEVEAMRFPSIGEGIVDVSDGLSKRELVNLVAEFLGGGDELVGNAGHEEEVATRG